MKQENIKKSDLLTTYEVTPDGFVVNEKGRTANEILKDIEIKLPFEVYNRIEYASASKANNGGFLAYGPKCFRPIVYTAQGSNEGWVIHLDMVNQNGVLTTLILWKVLSGPDDAKASERAIWDLVVREG